MDLFPDGQHVWLRSCGRGGKYLHADENGVGVRVSSKRASLRSAWKVHHAVGPGGDTYVLLHGAAYGRYLTVSRDPAPHGHKGRLVMQGSFNNNNFNMVAWRPARVGAGDGGDRVLLHHYSAHLLRANGEIFFWNKGVSADANNLENRNKPMSHWVVQAIPPRPLPPQLPAAVLYPHGGRLCMVNIAVAPGVPGRAIRFVRADDGTPAANAWNDLRFYGRSVFNLRAALARALDEPVLGIRLCARAGESAHLTPLTVDLPRHEMDMDVVVFIDGSPAAAALQYPDVDAQ